MKVSKTKDEIWTIFGLTNGKTCDIISLGGVREIHLLPYHRLGYDKYVGLDREYGMGDVKPPSNEQMERLRQVAEREGLKAIIGG